MMGGTAESEQICRCLGTLGLNHNPAIGADGRLGAASRYLMTADGGLGYPTLSQTLNGEAAGRGRPSTEATNCIEQPNPGR